MIISHLKLKNWRNFTEVDVPLRKRQFLVGPNASGKSNLLDVFRFLRDVAKQRGGGLQEAIAKRGGLSKIRCLSARREPEVVIGIFLRDATEDNTPKWQYEIGIKQETRGFRQPYLAYEKVWEYGKLILDRPNKEDQKDGERLKQTYLEQVNNNQNFREIGQQLNKISYIHLVPQLLRHADSIQGRVLEDDPLGQGFLENIARTNQRTLSSRMRAINNIIKVAVPKLEDVKLERDSDTGRPHITALYSHWRPNAGRQREDQFSDGTLRLMALIWSLLDGDGPLLLEEPELSLHAGIVERLAALLNRSQNRKNRQVLISTHSSELLSDPGIGGEEVLILSPTKEGTKVEVSTELADIESLLRTGAPVGEAVIPRTKPENYLQMELFNARPTDPDR